MRNPYATAAEAKVATTTSNSYTITTATTATIIKTYIVFFNIKKKIE